MQRTMLSLTILFACATTAWIASGCRSTGGGSGSSTTSTSTVRGTVTYRERIALPDEALLDVSLLDVSDVNSRLIALVQVPTNGAQVPLPFELSFVDALVLPGRDYAVTARISAGGELLFHTPVPVAAPLPAGGSELELVLRSAR